jgi:hypothetical protein
MIVLGLGGCKLHRALQATKQGGLRPFAAESVSNLHVNLLAFQPSPCSCVLPYHADAVVLLSFLLPC